ncbi:MAG: ABC transporter ATP-binding protein [Suipraeoptans sp.]
MRKRKNIVGRIFTLLKPYIAYILLLAAFSILTVAGTLYTPILIGEGVDKLVGIGNVDFKGLNSTIIKFLIVVFATMIFQWCSSLVTNHITFNVVKSMREKAFEHFQKLPVSYMDSHFAGDTISRITTDVDQFSDGMLMGLAQLFTGVITIIGTLLFMLIIHPGITLLVVCITPISFVVAYFLAGSTYKSFKEQSSTRAKMTTLVDEMVGNQQVVKAFSREKHIEDDFNKLNESLRKVSVRAVFFSSTVNPSTRFINGLVYTGVCVYGAFAAIGGGISVGQLASFINYANQYTKPFNEISGVITELQNALACASRVFEFMDEEETENANKDEKIADNLCGEITFENVFFSYDKERKFIKKLNIGTRPGQKIALVGPTGCGKTTLINLIMRFYEINDGEIRIDGFNIQELDKDSLRRNFGMVLQDTWLKTGTIADNIAYGNVNVTREEIIEAAKKARIHSFINKLPDKYDTIISEGGENISQGQRQLLSIARVFLRKPPMLILDEATSSIDTRTEIMIQETLDKLMEGRTSFIVAHRLSTIRSADKILVMSMGQIVESGKHEDLINLDGLYKRIYDSQFSVGGNS